MMLRFRYLAILSFIGSLMLAAYACVPAYSTGTPTPAPTTPVTSSYTISVASKDGVGNFLVDGRGMTLYWTTRDAPGQSNITGQVLANWPSFYSQNIVIPSNLNASDFGTIARPEGGNQTTYKGYPLYYYIKDQSPGDTLGQGVGGIWWLVDPTASAPTAQAVPTVTIVSPANGSNVAPGDLTVTIKVDNFNVVDKQGQANVPGEGHVHFYLDVPAPTTPGQPTIPPSGVWAHVSGTTYTFTNVTPGTHTIAVQLVNNDHSPVIPIVTAQVTITVTGTPATPVPSPSPAPAPGY